MVGAEITDKREADEAIKAIVGSLIDRVHQQRRELTDKVLTLPQFFLHFFAVWFAVAFINEFEKP